VDWLLRGVGGLIVLVAVRDIFHTLWHPQGFGMLAHRTIRLTWRAGRRLPRRGHELIGPVGMLLVFVVWTVLIVVGWAMIYLPSMPGGFHYQSPTQPGDSPDLLTAIYLSLVTAATLGFGDITPTTGALRLLTPLESLVGFVLLTAAISWVLQVYPALGRRRTTALQLHALAQQDAAALVRDGDPVVASHVLYDLSRDLSGVAVDMTQYAESYYFLERDSSMSLPANLPYVLTLVEAGRASLAPEVQLAARVLRSSLQQVTDQVSVNIGTEGSVQEVVTAFEQDHGDPPSRP
jgi:hypothetical protein